MDIKKPQLVKVGAFAYFFEGVLQHPRLLKCVSAANRDGEGYIGLDTKKRLSGSLVRTFRQSLYLSSLYL